MEVEGEDMEPDHGYKEGQRKGNDHKQIKEQAQDTRPKGAMEEKVKAHKHKENRYKQICAKCGKPERDHKGERNNQWLCCDRCGKWYVEQCAQENLEEVDGTDIALHYWQCSRCEDTEKALQWMVNEWEGMVEEVKVIRREPLREKQDRSRELD